MRKTVLWLSLLLVLSLVLAACAPAQPTAAPEPTQPPAVAPTQAVQESPAPTQVAEKKIVIAMVTDQHGLGDQGFNDITWAGIQKAVQDFNAEAKILESSEQAQYVPNLTSLAQEKDDLIVGVGFLLVDAMKEVATAFPDQKFALVDADVGMPNVRGLVFREQEGSFLGGVMAGMLTKTNKIGVLGGMEIPPVVRWISGFQAGVKTVNPQAEVMVSYAGSFADPAKGKEIALSLYDQGADIVFEVGGGSGVGAYQAAAERGEGVYVMGSDRCKDDLAPNNALPDVVKRVDVAVYDAAKAVIDGTFTGGEHTLGLKEGGMGLCDKTYPSLPDDVKAMIEKAQQMIIDGKIVPPQTMEELSTFTPPDLTQ
jgi:basic membrane protein A